MKRKEVYKIIDVERDYQDDMMIHRLIADEEKSVAEWINYIEYHLNKAKESVYHLDTQAALAGIRKVTALGVRTMEIHGAPERIIRLDTTPTTTECYGEKNIIVKFSSEPRKIQK
jgi:hypothetical protein